MLCRNVGNESFFISFLNTAFVLVRMLVPVTLAVIKLPVKLVSRSLDIVACVQEDLRVRLVKMVRKIFFKSLKHR